MTNREIEIKIKLTDAEALKKKVESLGGKKVSEDLEQDIYYDNDSGLYDSGKVLRLRKLNNGNLLTVKDPQEEHENLLIRGETQTSVADFDRMHEILQKLGFKEKYRKEKFSTHYLLDGMELLFHKLPFLGDFLEIEANEQALKNFLPRLGLSIEQGLNRGYHKLFMEYCKQQDWPENTPLTFEEERNKIGKRNH